MLLYRSSRGAILAWRQSEEVAGTGNISVPAASLTLTAFAPTVGGGTTAVAVPRAALTLTAYPPAITSTAQTARPRHQWEIRARGLGRVGSTVRRAAAAGGAVSVGVPRAALTLTAYAPGIGVAINYTSAGVLYLPIRMVSALWSVGAPTGSGEVAWLPPARQQMTYTDARTGQVFCDPAWYRFFEYIAEQRLGGKTGPAITTVVQTLTDTQTAAAAATSTVTELQQQTQANAEALYVTRAVVKGAGLSGSDQIPFVEL